jgi:UDP-N-acetylglucosamine 3-dehydrogenase
MTDRIGLGIISYAHPHAAKYTAAIAACPWADLGGIAGLGVNADSAAEEAERYDVSYYADYRDLLAREDLVGVYVGTEPTRHLEVVRQAAAHGKHVLCDKPIALTLGEADDIIRAAEGAGVKLMVSLAARSSR